MENEVISSAVRDIFEDSFGSYGAQRIKAELSKRGYRVSRPRVARIIRANSLFARRNRKFKVTTDSRRDYAIAPNILERDFMVFRDNQVWVSDMTYIKTGEGWMYLTVIIDLFDRKVVGWAMSGTLDTGRTIIPAWRMTVRSNPVDGELIFRSDRDSQCTSYDFTDILKNKGKLVTIHNCLTLPFFFRRFFGP